MNKQLEISDDSGFIGLANLSKYNSFIGRHWDFELMKERIVAEINNNNLLFWGTGREDKWKVLVTMDSEKDRPKPFRTTEALIEVSSNKLHLVNYETLTMAAQFEKVTLPEKHLQDLQFELDNGLYLVTFAQLVNPEFSAERGEVDFEIRLELVNDPEEYYPNDFGNIFWNVY